jgi:exodeoxyribonuclease-3
MKKSDLRIVTWNINSVRKRLGLLGRLVEALDPDVICLQETKVTDDLFPDLAIEALGYTHRLVHGQKGYNGVAILSRRPFLKTATRPWCGRPDCRHASAVIDSGGGIGAIEVHSLYIPAGGDLADPERNPKFAHKLDFLDEGARWSRARRRGQPGVLCGDFNVAPLETDVWSHAKMRKVVSHTEPEIERLNRMQAAGPWIDAIRKLKPEPEPVFTWWSYRAADWTAVDRGRRLDHVWLSENLGPRLTGCTILKEARGWDGPSDHAPVMVTLDSE